jgi:hypothetical protein
VPARTSAWLDQAEHQPNLVLDELLKPTQAVLDYLEQGYEAYKEAERDKTIQSLQQYQHDFEKVHPERANALKWEMFDVLSVADQASVLKEKYVALESNTSAISIGEKDHPLYQEIGSFMKDHSSVMDYWNKHDIDLIDRMQQVWDRANTEPEPAMQTIEPEVSAVEPEKAVEDDMELEMEHEIDMYYGMDFEMEL